MSKEITIKHNDLSTLPIDGRRVAWLTSKEAQSTKNWKEGEYVAKESLFMECEIGVISGDFDFAIHVERWKYIMTSNDVLHIISRGNNWAVVKSGKTKALALEKYREKAYYRAKLITNKIVVHNKDGSVFFTDY